MAETARVFAELEWAMIREGIKAAKNFKRSRREWMSHHETLGWDEGPEGTPRFYDVT